MGQPITDPISGPSFDFTFTIGPELDNKHRKYRWFKASISDSDPRVAPSKSLKVMVVSVIIRFYLVTTLSPININKFAPNPLVSIILAAHRILVSALVPLELIGSLKLLSGSRSNVKRQNLTLRVCNGLANHVPPSYNFRMSGERKTSELDIAMAMHWWT